MHPYIPHLLADIAAACRPEIDIEEMFREPQTLEEHFEEIERWTEGEDPERTFGYYCGLESMNFPPMEQLTVKDMKLVCKAFERLLFTWNSGIDLPKNLPVNMRYHFIVNTLNEEFTPVNSGFMTIGYCNGYAPDCIFKEYCTCLEFWNDLPDDDMDDVDTWSDELPF